MKIRIEDVDVKDVFMYKVVDNDDKSIFADGKFCKTYSDGSIVEKEPNSIGLFVFEDLQTAKNYLNDIISMHGCDKAKIKLVKIIGSFRKPPEFVISLFRNWRQESQISEYNSLYSSNNFKEIKYKCNTGRSSYQARVCDKLKVIRTCFGG